MNISLLLLRLGEKELIKISRIIDNIASYSLNDKRVYNFSAVIGGDTGLSFICTDELLKAAKNRLSMVCRRQKYKHKAKEWFGLCLSSEGNSVRFPVYFNEPWVQNEKRDEESGKLAPTATNSFSKLLKKMREHVHQD